MISFGNVYGSWDSMCAGTCALAQPSGLSVFNAVKPEDEQEVFSRMSQWVQALDNARAVIEQAASFGISVDEYQPDYPEWDAAYAALGDVGFVGWQGSVR